MISGHFSTLLSFVLILILVEKVEFAYFVHYLV